MEYSPSKPPRNRPLSFALPSPSSGSGGFSFNSSHHRPISPDSTSTSTSSSSSSRPRPNHRSTASLSSLAQLNLNGGTTHQPIGVTSPLERSPSLHWGTFSTSASTTQQSNNGVGKEFEHVQNKTFAKWLNARLQPEGLPLVTDLGIDFSDGTRLIQLIEILTGESLGRYNHFPVLRVQKMENTKQALDRIKQLGVHLTNIGPEDIVDGNRKLILGMIWSLVLRFSIADINEQGSHAKDGLLLWCQRKTIGYEKVLIKDFTKSWIDGLAFCALIHSHRPDLLDYNSVLNKDPTERLNLAFKIAQESLGIPQLLDVEDVCSRKPDERSLMTYVAQFFHAFSSKARQESESRVISNFVENMSQLMLSVHDYERRVTVLLSSISAHLETLLALQTFNNPNPPPSYQTLSSLLESFTGNYYKQIRRNWLKEKFELIELLYRIQEKLKTYGLRPYEPSQGFQIKDLKEKWFGLEKEEFKFVKNLKRDIERLRRDARGKLLKLFKETLLELKELKDRMREDILVGTPLETQLEQCRRIESTRLPILDRLLLELDEAETLCNSLDLPIPILLAYPTFTSTLTFPDIDTDDQDEEDINIHSAEGLKWEFKLVTSKLIEKKSFIENQIVARKQTNLSPEQLEEFESAFKAFDKDERNKLGLDELVGALGSLGVAEINLEEIQQDENDQVSFEEFIRFLTARAEDRLTGEKVRSCFRSIASEKGYVTELDLTRLQLPSSSLQFLKEHMPQNSIRVPVTTTNGVDVGDAGVDDGKTKEELVLDYEEFLNQFLE